MDYWGSRGMAAPKAFSGKRPRIRGERTFHGEEEDAPLVVFRGDGLLGGTESHRCGTTNSEMLCSQANCEMVDDRRKSSRC